MNPILNHIPNLKHLGSGMFFVMAGPCVVENEEVMMRVAEKACAVTDALKIPYIFKASYRKANRSRLDSFCGIGDEKALKLLDKVRREFGVPTVTDIHNPEEAAIAAQYADRLIITTDNPRHESQQQTINDVRRGVPADKECEEFVDRKAAIYRALETAQPGELIALCGKGHEDYQAIGDENVPFNEREIVLDWLKSRGII